MIAQQIIAGLRARPHNLGVIFRYLAEQLYDAHLADGQRLLDATDFKAWLRELAEASTVHGQSFDNPHRQQHLENTCPRCGHIHQGEAECGEDLGGGRICRCELPVPA